jgi:uncharacterized protein (TIGR04222 family)
VNPNPIFPEMTGPHFLAFYALLFAVIAFGVSHFLKTLTARESTAREEDLDPVEVAYLSGANSGKSTEAVVNTALFSLYQQGIVELSDGKIRRHEGKERIPAPKRTALDIIQESILHETRESKSAGELQNAVKNKAQDALAPVKEKLEREKLLLRKEEMGNQYLPIWAGYLIFIGVGAARLIGAFAASRAFAFLVVEMIAFTIAYHVILRPRHLSSAGRRLLDSLKAREKDASKLVGVCEPLPHHLTLLIALFGFSILSGTAGEDFRKFIAPVGSSGGGCGG